MHRMMKTKLPEPDSQDLDRSLKLRQKICREMKANGGLLSFERYMDMCLYTEGLGYYASNQPIFGEQGDFVTSSERSTIFAQAFGAHLKTLSTKFEELNIIEIGAGSGQFAAQLLEHLSISDVPVKQYYIIEKSVALRARQQTLINTVIPQQCSNVQWLDSIGDPIKNAVVIANEVIDALPVRLLTIKSRQILERFVRQNSDQEFSFTDIPAEEDLISAVHSTLEDSTILSVDQPYNTEICMQLPGFVQQMASLVQQGIFFFIDYGYPRSEYYLVQRSMGTLLCHYKNTAHDNPLIWPGLQDISSNVDFTALAEAGVEAGLKLNSYSTQAHFLLASNILASLEKDAPEQKLIRASQQLKHLMLPSEMGERFQVMTFTKNMTLDQTLFTTRDLSYRL